MIKTIKSFLAGVGISALFLGAVGVVGAAVSQFGLPGYYTATPSTLSNNSGAAIAVDTNRRVEISSTTPIVVSSAGTASNPIPIYASTTTLSGFTQGSVLFTGASGVITEDNNALFYSDSADYLKVGSTTIYADYTTNTMKIETDTSGRTVEFFTATAETNASTSTILQIPVAEKEVKMIEVTVVGSAANPGARATFHYDASYYRSIGGNITQIGTDNSLTTLRVSTIYSSFSVANATDQTIDIKVRSTSFELGWVAYVKVVTMYKQ